MSGTLTAGGKSKGLILDIGGYYKNVFTVAPSLYITEQEIDTAIALFEGSPFAREAFGDEFVEHYLHFLATEQRKFDEIVTCWERARFFERG